MADNSVFSESLAYGAQKRRAVSARSFRVKIPPSNSTIFSDGQTIQVDLPGNLAGQYYNMNQMYLKVNVTPTVACSLDRVGALGFIKRLQISTAGAQIADINNYNVLASAMLDTDASSEYKAGYGNVMLGTLGDALKGEDIGAGVSRVFCIPMVLNPLSMTTPHRLIPAFALSSLQFRFTLDSAASAVLSGADCVLNFKEVEMVCMMTELSPQAQSMVDSSTGGKYNILANSFMNSGATRQGGDTALTANLGFSVSSLERIIAIHRPSATIDIRTTYSLGNRGTAGLSEFQYLVNSESYPARPVIIDAKGAESMAETLIADHALADFKKSATFNNGFARIGAVGDFYGVGTSALSGVAPGQAKSDCFMIPSPIGTTAGVSAVPGVANSTPSDVGTFVVATEFESGLSDGKSSTIYSGISTIASVVQWVGKYAVPTASAFTIDFFAQYTVLLSLDTRGSGVWSISV